MSDMIITNRSQLTLIHKAEHANYAYDKYEVTDAQEKYETDGALHGHQCVVAFYSIPPGKSSYPLHYHSTNEEVFYIISGEGALQTPDGIRQVAAGDVIVCPAGKQGAHKLTNASETAPLVYLDVDTNRTPDIVYYPDSGKVGIRAAGGVHENYRLDAGVDYYDGE